MAKQEDASQYVKDYSAYTLLCERHTEGWNPTLAGCVILTCQLSQLLSPLVLGGDDAHLKIRNTCC